ncbi:MAG TPA: outer membrane protein assembly factor BamE [Alphaproteobacteria bacterium]|nr:outer membrane protein assembly factor BamE [Alphaproteobacteria bacterium]
MKNNIALLTAPLLLTACAAMVDTHGSIIQQGQIEKITEGVTTQDQVRELLGSPATTGTLNENRWIYITSTVRDKPLDPGILTHRQVVVIDFTPSGTVAAVTQKNESDSRTVEPLPKVTPTHGQGLGVIDQMLKNIGVDKDK